MWNCHDAPPRAATCRHMPPRAATCAATQVEPPPRHGSRAPTSSRFAQPIGQRFVGRCICFTDDASGLEAEVEARALPQSAREGWWHKAFLFSPAAGLQVSRPAGSRGMGGMVVQEVAAPPVLPVLPVVPVVPLHCRRCQRCGCLWRM